MDDSDDITADDLFRPFTFENFIEQNMTNDFDKSFKHDVALKLLQHYDKFGTHTTRIKAIKMTKAVGNLLKVICNHFFATIIVLAGLAAISIFIHMKLGAFYAFASAFLTVIGWFWRVAIPLPGPQLLIKYKEANQDAIIRDHAPHDLYSGIYYGWPGYHSANKTVEFEDIIAKRIERGNKSDFSMICKYQGLFSKNSVIMPETYKSAPHKWALVGVWALDTPKPEGKGKWDARPEFEDFAKKEFANAVLTKVKSSSVLKPRRRREFEEQFSVKSFFENIMSASDKDNAEMMALDELLKLQKSLN